MSLVAIAIAGAAAAAYVALAVVARARGWRLRRRLSRLYRPVLTGEGCLSCGTDYLFARAHPTPYERDDSTYVVMPLCARCRAELDVDGRLPFYAEVLNRWRRDGVYEHDDGSRWDRDRAAIFYAVKVGL